MEFLNTIPVMDRTALRELKKGIDLEDPNEPDVIIGTSHLAAQKAVANTALSRCLIP